MVTFISTWTGGDSCCTRVCVCIYKETGRCPDTERWECLLETAPFPYPHPHHILHPKSPLLTPPWLILRPGAVIPEPYSSTGPCLFFPFIPYLPPASASFPLSGWHHRLWQENKSVSDRCRLASERRPWQLSIKSPRLFFFFFLFLISDDRLWNPAVSITGAY